MGLLCVQELCSPVHGMAWHGMCCSAVRCTCLPWTVDAYPYPSRNLFRGIQMDADLFLGFKDPLMSEGEHW